MARDHVAISNLSPGAWALIRHHFHKSSGWSNETRRENLFLVQDVLDCVKLKFWLANGTALGFYRDGDFIPWDDDTDLDVMAEEFEPVFEVVRNKLLDMRFVVRADYGKIKMSVFRGGEKLSLRGLYLDKSYKGNKYRLRDSYKYPRRFFQDGCVYVYHDRLFSYPCPIIEYLEYCYGKDWRKPFNSDNEREYSTKRIRR